jgi:hypothetical protein
MNEVKQTNLDGFFVSKTGKPICPKCGHFVNDRTFHPDPKTGLFRSTIWCICDCYEKVKAEA